MESCHNYLQSQIDMIHPKVIGVMGNTAAGALLNLQGVTALRGRVLQGRFLVTYHPAAVLRNNHLQEAFVSDLKKIKEIGSCDQ